MAARDRETGRSRRRRCSAAGFAALFLTALLAAGCTGPHRGPPIVRPGRVPVTVPVPPRGEGVLLVRVGLVAAVPEVVLEGGGELRLLDERRRRRGRAPAGKVRCRVHPAGLAWQAGGAGGTGTALLVAPEDPGRPLRWQGRAYAGEIWILRDPGGLTVVNVVPLEQYLRGVVPWEIGRVGREGLAALCAQAVAARTYTVSHLGEREALGFDLWADVRDQVYRGLERTDPWADRAIRETRGVILRYGDAPVEAYYSACCGGWCSDVAAVWPRTAQPYLTAHPDTAAGGRDWCADAPSHDWTASWTAAELERVLRRTLPAYLDWLAASPARGRWAGPGFRPARPGADPRRPGRLLGLAVTDTTPSGRVALLSVRTTAGEYRVRGDRVRWVLVPPDDRRPILRSARFRLRVTTGADGRPGRIAVVGKGNGHGIGMCQAGAVAMARAGRDWREILAHYYPGAVAIPAAGEGGRGTSQTPATRG